MLTPEEQERMVARLQGEEPEQEVQETAPEAEEEPIHEEEAEEEVTSVEAAEAEDEQEEEEGGHAVPYDRFRQVNERRKTLQSEIADRDRQLEELQAKLNQQYQQAERPQESYSDDFEDFEEADPDSWSARFNQMEKANKEMQIKLAHMDIQREVHSASQEFPNVPESYMWDMIAQNGNMTAHQAAQQYSEFVGEIEEAAIARYLNEQKVEAAPDAPPRPSSQQTVGTEYLAEPESPRTLDEARQAMVMYLNS
tara:strand:+ start:1831 stop:2589 length:759 start_codon:yes stop_codon:yes gene_type:complete